LYLLEGNKYTGYHRQGFEIPNNLPKEEKYIRYTKYLPDGDNTGFYMAGILFQTFCTKVLRSTVYREQYYTVQYPGISIENLPEENKYTEIPNRAISKYRFITEPQEILES
jgi:hypothetical protein